MAGGIVDKRPGNMKVELERAVGVLDSLKHLEHRVIAAGKDLVPDALQLEVRLVKMEAEGDVILIGHKQVSFFIMVMRIRRLYSVTTRVSRKTGNPGDRMWLRPLPAKDIEPQ